MVCIFCLFHKDRDLPNCSYGMRHEYPIGEPVKQAVKIDKKLCIKCGMHPKNPKAVGCVHVLNKGL